MCLGLIATRVPRTPANIILEAERNGWEGCAHCGQEFFLKTYFGYSDGYEGWRGRNSCEFGKMDDYWRDSRNNCRLLGCVDRMEDERLRNSEEMLVFEEG